MRPPIREGDARAGHQILHGVGHKDLAGLGCPHDTGAGVYRDAADWAVVILDLTGVYANPHRHPKSLHSIADRIPAADGGGCTVEDGEDLVRNYIYLVPTVAGKPLAVGGGFPPPHLQPAAIPQPARAGHAP